MKIWITLLISAFIVFAGYNFFLSPKGILSQYQLKQNNLRLQLEIDSLKKNLKETKTTIQRLKHDSLYMESIIRTQLGMTQPTEKAFRFIKPKAK